MRFSHFIAGASVLGAAVAAPLGHEHKAKRDSVTTTVHAQVTVVVGGDGTAVTPTAAVVQAAPVVASVAASAAPVSSSVASAAPASAAPASSAAASSAPASSAAASSSSSSSAAASSSSSSSSDSAAGAAGAKGIVYSPYTDSGSCKSASQVAADLAILADYPIIRLYGVDCDQVENVLQGKSSSQKLFLGIYFMDQIAAGVSQMASAIEKYGSWDDVVTVSIGNELVNSGAATPSQVGAYVATGKSSLQSAGYSGPVVSVDTFIAVINNPDLCQHSDYVAINAHAYFDQNTVAADAGTWLVEQIQRVSTTCSNEKSVVVTESGWPSQGQTYGVAVPSKENQAAAIKSITSSCGSDTYLFTAFNDLWKADGAYGVEKYFGILAD